MKAKMKTRKAAAKRFKITASGKVLHRRQNTGCGHLRTKKAPKRKRQLKEWAEISPYEAYKVKMMMPYS